MAEKENNCIVIEPKRNLFYINFKELFQYKDLLFLLVWKDFIVRYKQTILGPLWFIFQPLLTTIVFTIFFHRIANVPTDGIPPMLFYLCGLLVWDFFSKSVINSSISLLSYSHIINKVYFPRLILPISSILSNFFTFFIQLINFLIFYFYFKFFTHIGIYIKPNINLLFIPLLLLQVAIFSLGIGLLVCALTSKYRDLHILINFLIGIWMYATPIIYPVSVIPPHYRFVLAVNPLASIIDLFRYTFFGTIYLSYKYLVISIFSTFFILIVGLISFNKVEKTITDTI